MEPGRNWSGWYDFCGEEEVTSGRQEAQDKRKEGRGGHGRGEDVKSTPRKRAKEYCGENENIKRGKRKEQMYSSSTPKEDWKDY